MIEFGKARVAIVCGGRGYGEAHGGNTSWVAQQQKVFDVLDKAVGHLGMEAIVQGGASGADYCAYLWAQARGFPCGSFPADWQTYGSRAGPLRNQQMLDEAKPTWVIAFPGGRGTRNMCFLAERAPGVAVYRIGWKP